MGRYRNAQSTNWPIIEAERAAQALLDKWFPRAKPAKRKPIGSILLRPKDVAFKLSTHELINGVCFRCQMMLEDCTRKQCPVR